MIVDDGFGSSKMYTHKFPRKLVLVGVVDGAFSRFPVRNKSDRAVWRRGGMKCGVRRDY
jgi:hypothetical protein